MSATNKEILKWSEIVSAIQNAPLMDSLQIPDIIRQLVIELSFNWHWDPAMTFGICLEKDNTKIHHYMNKQDEQNRIVHSPMGWQTTRGNICLDDANGYVYEWDIEATNFADTGDIIIGILADDGSRPDPENVAKHQNEGFIDNAEMWAYHSTNEYNEGGFTVHQISTREIGGNVDHDKELDVSFGIGDVITIIYDSKMKTLRFKKNGKKVIDMKSHYSNIPKDATIIYEDIKGDIFPFVTIFDNDATVSLLDIRYYSL